jgi:signal transduction histidine kinase
LALGFTVLGARLAEKSHLSLLRRDAGLKRTNEELARASQLKSEFLSTMSHELRTPLNVIIGYLDLLEDGAFGALAVEQSDPVQRAGCSARSLFELITATLDLSRIDAGVFSLDLRPVDLRELLGALVVGAGELPIGPGVDLRWDIEPELDSLETDQRMLNLVLRNLVGNALKFTEHGSVVITARRQRGGVEFLVSDTGIGISLEAQAKIFEPFHQVARPETENAGGVGLGLHIVCRLVSLLGGDLGVESVPGEGATFRVWLPRSRRPNDPLDDALPATPSSGAEARTTP